MSIFRGVRQRAVSGMMSLGPSHPVTSSVLSFACKQQGVTLHSGEGYIALRKGEREMRLAKHHYAYAPDMAKRFDLYYPIVEPFVSGNFRVVDFSSPRLQRYSKSGLEFELASFPEEEDSISDYFRWYRPTEGELVFDIGAHCGVSTHAFATCVGPTGHVYALEPDPINFELLVRNIKRHNLTNVTPIQAALSDENGTARFNSEGTIGSGLVSTFDRPTAGTTVEVETRTFESLAREFGVPKFCKIDIEGAEIEVLEQAGGFLSRNPVHLVLDTHHFVRGEKTTAKVEALLRKAGYRVESSDESGTTSTWGAFTV